MSHRHAWALIGVGLLHAACGTPSASQEPAGARQAAEAPPPSPRCARDVLCAEGALDVLSFDHTCTASAAVLTSYQGVRSLLVGPDQGAEVLIYGVSGGAPIAPAITLRVDRSPMDLEAATQFEGQVYMVASHSLNDHRLYRDARHQITRLPNIPAGVTKKFALTDEDDRFRSSLASLPTDALPARWARLASGDGGLAIEGVAVKERSLLLGLRSPLARVHDVSYAIVLPWVSWLDELETTGHPRVMGEPLLVDLEGRGIRDMVWWESAGQFLIVAGPEKRRPKGPAGQRAFAVFAWDGTSTTAKRLSHIDTAPKASPEALVLDPQSDTGVQIEALILFDEGRATGCGKHDPVEDRHFHAWRVVIEDPNATGRSPAR